MRTRLEADLKTAMKARDKSAVGVLRNLIGAIDNAGAVEAGPAGPPIVGRRADVPRRALSDGDINGLIRREAAEIRSALREYESLGRNAEAAELREKLAVAERYEIQE
ncbi:MAG: GatB/YqeY domain-containing protein [Gemmatimonadota bacterium]|nr:GatB/YqeY domain-containing protein [Gemmatimonadota bacterium]